jgi:hypothetical protein
LILSFISFTNLAFLSQIQPSSGFVHCIFFQSLHPDP